VAGAVGGNDDVMTDAPPILGDTFYCGGKSAGSTVPLLLRTRTDRRRQCRADH